MTMYKKRKMLIVDSIDIDRDILKDIFKNEFDILEAADGQAAVELVNQHKNQICVALLDMQISMVSSASLLEYHSADPVFSKIPVIAITINDDTRTQMEAFQMGAADYITKPFIEEIIRYRIKNVLSTRQAEQAAQETEILRVKAERDMMTGIYNKVTSEHLVSSLLAANDTICAMLVIDIDDFKQVNDVYGHLEGDRVICAIADMLSNHFRKTDIVGRIGGDEFLVFMSGLPSMELARQKADNFLKLLKYKPIPTYPIHVSVSIGMAITQPRSYTYRELFKQADEALYQAKRNGKGQYAEYGLEKSPKARKHTVPNALLFSKNRDICNAIHLISEDIQLFTIVSQDEPADFKKESSQKPYLLYIDISAEDGGGDVLLKQTLAEDYLQDIPFIAICQEGNIKQYSAAIQKGAVDILPAPIDTEFAKRRIKEFFC